MKNAIRTVVCMSLLVYAGCAASPIDISGVTSEQELDKHLGERVTFTGKWQNWKEAGLSNGHVFVSPDLAFWGGSHAYDIGETETVTGYLTKVVVDYSGLPPHSPKERVSQEPSPGSQYYIEKDQPNKDSTVRRYPNRQ